MTRITRVEIITDTGRDYVCWEEDNDITVSYQDDGRTLKVFVNKVKSKSPAEEAFKRVYGAYPMGEPFWIVFKKGYDEAQKDYEVGEYQPTPQEPKKEQKWDVVRESVKWCEEHREESVEDYLTPHTPKPMNEVLDRLENKYENDDVVNRILKKWEENPPDFLRFELSKSLEDRIYKWWETCFVHHPEWSMEECVEDLLDIITLFLPGEQNSEGTQNIDTVVAVEVHNELLQKIKSKLRNKKDT